MMVFPIWIKLANVAAVQRSHDADPREHSRPAQVRSDRGVTSPTGTQREAPAPIAQKAESPAAWRSRKTAEAVTGNGAGSGPRRNPVNNRSEKWCRGRAEA
jgi:hypothetical protein